jgi:hypothetical protein
MFPAVVSLRAMFSLDANTNNINTVTDPVMGRWWLSSEWKQFQSR